MSAAEENYSLKIEAAEVVKEIRFAVHHVTVSDKLNNTDELVFMNIETQEKQKLCIELSASGFRVWPGRENMLHPCCTCCIRVVQCFRKI